MLNRTIGKILRGDATPFQLFTAAFLGTVIAFIPGFAAAPGIFLLFTFLLLILNANLGVAALVGMGAKLLALLLTPVSFEVGYFLLDGPTSAFFTKLINAPVFAWFGFERYVATGGLVLGIILGIILGLLINMLIGRFRRKMADVEKNSDKYKDYSKKFWVRALSWLLIGGRHKKKSYEELLSNKYGNPIRTIGLVVVILISGFGFLIAKFASEPVATAVLQSSLESANGATVDLEAVKLDLKANHARIQNLAMADPGALDTDLFRADVIEADISASNLLRKRLLIDRLEISNGSHGEKRGEPGKLLRKPAEAEEEEEEPLQIPDAKRIDEYIEDYKVWKERLRQAREWLDKMSGPGSPETGDAPGKKETLRERLEREIREKGYAGVIASHLIEGSPTLAITEAVAAKVRVSELEGETLDIVARNISTQPGLLGKKPELHVTSSGSTFSFDSVLGRFESPDLANEIGFSLKGLSTDSVMKNIKSGGVQPVQGGTMDVKASGNWNIADSSIDLPLHVTLHDATLQLEQLGGRTKVERLEIPIAVQGPLDSPGIRLQSEELKNALVSAGVSKAKSVAKEKAAELIDKELKDKVGESIGEKGKDLLGGFLGGGKKKDDEN